MKQKLLVVALAGAFASPAMADVTISGTVNAGPYFTQSGDSTAGPGNAVTGATTKTEGFSQYGITSNYSNINLRSEEDLGNGLKVLFQYQIDISQTGSPIQSTNSTLRTRNSYLGLGGGWGAVKFGTNENVYEQYLYQADPLDGAAGVGGNLQMFGSPGYGVVFDVGQSGVNATNGSAGFYRRTDQNLWYESPDFGGFTFGASYSLNAYQTSSNGTKPQVMSLGGQFKPADLPFYVNLAYERHKDLFGLEVITGAGTATESTDTGVKLQGGVMFGDLTVGAIVEQLKYKSSGGALVITEYKRTAYGLHAKYNLPSGYIGANFGIAQDGKIQTTGTGDAKDSGATYFGLGYFHNLSKQTQLQVIGSMVSNKDNASYILAGSSTAVVAPGADHRAIYFGIKHSF
ncbi:MAG: porin [Burkholderiales bacterium]|nr:porin [Burkholderiales bacterium]